MADSPTSEMNPPKRLRTDGSEEEMPRGGQARERGAVDVVGDRPALPYLAHRDALLTVCLTA